MSGDYTDVNPPPDTERRTVVLHLTDAQIDVIAQRVENRFYQRFGRRVAEKLLWLLGIAVVGAVFFFAGKGVLPK